MTSAGILSPLKISIYRRIWTASLLTNFGTLVLGVGAAWIMTQLTDKPSMVALVQTALMLPLMLWSIPAGALADMYDRRKIALTGLYFSSANSAILCVLAWQQLLTPIVVLTSCFLMVRLGSTIYACEAARLKPNKTFMQSRGVTTWALPQYGSDACLNGLSARYA